jgi:ArsR family transcriptional regulator
MRKRVGGSDKEPASLPLADMVQRDEELARLAWALAHPTRVRILRLLLDRQACVCGELVEELPLAQSTVSQHLKILKESGLIQGTVDGPKVCYCVALEVLQRLKSRIAEL